MPDNLLELIPGTNSTYNAWIDIITNAKKTLHLAFFYSNLRVDAPKETGSWQGTAIFNALVAAKRERGVEIIIVQVGQNNKYFNMQRVNLMLSSQMKILKRYKIWELRRSFLLTGQKRLEQGFYTQS
jgi:hypothetical protein